MPSTRSNPVVTGQPGASPAIAAAGGASHRRAFPALNTSDFVEQAHQQSLAIASSATARIDQDFVDSIGEWNSVQDAE
jgi:hypothetical protein